MTGDQYRSAIAQIGGVTCAKDLYAEGFTAMMGYFEYIAFAPIAAKGPNYGPRDGMASFAQMKLIRSLWSEITRRAYADEDAFDTWLLSKFKVSALALPEEGYGAKGHHGAGDVEAPFA